MAAAVMLLVGVGSLSLVLMDSDDGPPRNAGNQGALPATTAPPRSTRPASACPTRTTGPAAPFPDVRSALKTAAAHTYWRSTPSIKIPERLLQAVAMTESTWRSNVLACDGGIGLMQVMPGTVKHINGRFGTSWNANTLQGNAYVGGNYDLANPALLDAVISAYNYGAAAVDPTKGAAGIPNPAYVNKVKGYLASCPCDNW